MTATITVHGGLTAAPEIRYTNGGVAIASGTVASTDRYLDRQTNEWKDGKKLFLRWSAFKDLAEHIAASNLDKGSQVTVTGKLHTREFTDRDGNPRSSTELEVIDFAVSLKKATAQVTRATSGQREPAPVSEEPWSTPGNPTVDAWSTPGSFGSETSFGDMADRVLTVAAGFRRPVSPEPQTEPTERAASETTKSENTHEDWCHVVTGCIEPNHCTCDTGRENGSAER